MVVIRDRIGLLLQCLGLSVRAYLFSLLMWVFTLFCVNGHALVVVDMYTLHWLSCSTLHCQSTELLKGLELVKLCTRLQKDRLLDSVYICLQLGAHGDSSWQFVVTVCPTCNFHECCEPQAWKFGRTCTKQFCSPGGQQLATVLIDSKVLRGNGEFPRARVFVSQQSHQRETYRRDAW